MEIVWAGGHRTAAQITRPVACLTQLSYYPQLAARARELADGGFTIPQIAQRLNAEGFRPPKRSPVFTPNAVSDLLRALGIQRSRIPAGRNRPALDQHEWWLRDLAGHLGMSEVSLDSGSAAAGLPVICTPRPGCAWSVLTRPRSSGSEPCTRCRAGSTTAAPG